MTAVLGFVLGTAAAMALAGAALSTVAVVCWPAVARLPAGRRADAVYGLLLLPALGALAVGAAVATPSVRHAVGLAADHCFDHVHHAHLCWLHGAELPPVVALAGAAALAVFVFRAGRTLSELSRANGSAARLARLGRLDGDRIWVPGSPRLCHVVGVIRPRILVSSSLRDALPGDALEVALAHERAHVDRRDPLVGASASLLAAFVLPGLAERLLRGWRQAAEEAADAEAAAVHGPLPVADALLAFARLQATPLDALGFGAVGLEARVRHLLGARVVARPCRAGLLTLALALAASAVLMGHHEAVHHGVEELATSLGR